MSDLASAIGVAAAESALISELKSGSEEAFGQLIAQYSRPIYSLIARSLRDPADAADVTQEVFVKVFRHIASFHGESSLRTWIYRIALHEASNQRRWWGRHKQKETALDAESVNDEGETFRLVETLPSAAATPYECCCSSETRARMQAALTTLPEVFRTVVVLREIEGFGYDEIAEMLQLNLGTVKSRLTRGRAALRLELLREESCAKHQSSANHVRSTGVAK